MKQFNVKNILKRNNIRAKKSFGQNFLIDEAVFSKIDNFIGNIKDDIILEIGPGVGSLTKIILDKNPQCLYMVEKDADFIAIITELIKEYDIKTQIIQDDALFIAEEDIIDQKYIIISNLPYNISTALLTKWFKKLNNIKSLFLMFQKEVADRLVAKPRSKSYGSLSVITQYLCDIDIGFDIEPQSFIPAPKVRSTFLKLIPKYDIDYEIAIKLEKVTKACFANRRKMLAKTLKQILPKDKLNQFEEYFTKRAEELSLEEFLSLSEVIL